jgi:hypothetical protein
MFKGLLAASVAVTAWLFVRLMPVQSWGEAVAASIAVLVLFGHHSFAGAIEGVYPFGVEIILVACQFAILGILLRERTTASDVWAFAISLFAILLNEKGGIVGATYIVGCLLRMSGGSMRGAGAVFAGYLAVLAARFFWYRSLASFMRRSEVSDLSTALFDALAPALNILISDPRFGKLQTIPQAFGGEPWAVVTLASSLATTGMIVAWAISADRKSAALKVSALLIVSLVASMMFGAFSRKDYIPIMALPPYALAAFFAMRWMFCVHRRAALALACLLFVAWGLRTAGLGYYMAQMAYGSQEEWRQAEKYGQVHEHDPAITVPIITRMRGQALAWQFQNPHDKLPRFVVRLLRGRNCPELCR